MSRNLIFEYDDREFLSVWRGGNRCTRGLVENATRIRRRLVSSRTHNQIPGEVMHSFRSERSWAHPFLLKQTLGDEQEHQCGGAWRRDTDANTFGTSKPKK